MLHLEQSLQYPKYHNPAFHKNFFDIVAQIFMIFKRTVLIAYEISANAKKFKPIKTCPFISAL